MNRKMSFHNGGVPRQSGSGSRERATRGAFTLVELVVVVMILGILAAVAAPKLLGTTKTASENSARQSLSVIRDAIERYAADNGGDLPSDPAAQLINDGYLRGPFPVCPVGAGQDSAAVNIDGNGSAEDGWAYDYQGGSGTGEFTINDDDYEEY